MSEHGGNGYKSGLSGSDLGKMSFVFIAIFWAFVAAFLPPLGGLIIYLELK